MGRLTIDMPTELGGTDAEPPTGRGSFEPGRRDGLDGACRGTVDRFVRWVETWAGR